MAERNGILGLLASGIPLSLLLDLALPNGPDSAGIARAEGVQAESQSAS